jgi:inositol transport system permease protein
MTRYGLILALVGICLGLAWATPHFLTATNLVLIVQQISINGILAIGVTFVLLTGGVDLSVGSLVALTGVVAACAAHPNQFPVGVPVALGLLAGLACGAVNGTLVTFGRVAPFVVTLGMMAVARGLALVISGGRPVSDLSAPFQAIWRGKFLGLPVPILFMAGVAVAAHLLLRRMRLGRHLYAVGGNELAARASGIQVRTVKMFAYMACGALAGLAGVLTASRTTTGQPNAAVAAELDAIAAAVIGGTSLAGGIGGIWGTLLGALLMGVLINGLDLLNVSSYYQQIIKGIIIVAAVLMDRGRHK